jgi:mRNA interferase YafQ
MKEIIQTNRFRRDLKRIRKRGYDLRKLGTIINLLATGEPLPDRHRPHKLSGEFGGLWECHVEPDWLLVYDVTEQLVELAATGTHADLFR